MSQKKSALERLIGKIVLNTDSSISHVAGLKQNVNDPDNELTLIGIQLFFQDYILNIYNRFEIVPQISGIDKLAGLEVISISDNSEKAEIFFKNGSVLRVDLRDEAYLGPEAMVLYGPNNFWSVWN